MTLVAGMLMRMMLEPQNYRCSVAAVVAADGILQTGMTLQTTRWAGLMMRWPGLQKPVAGKRKTYVDLPRYSLQLGNLLMQTVTATVTCTNLCSLRQERQRMQRN